MKADKEKCAGEGWDPFRLRWKPPSAGTRACSRVLEAGLQFSFFYRSSSVFIGG
jgi:hypothetical protein